MALKADGGNPNRFTGRYRRTGTHKRVAEDSRSERQGGMNKLAQERLRFEAWVIRKGALPFWGSTMKKIIEVRRKLTGRITVNLDPRLSLEEMTAVVGACADRVEEIREDQNRPSAKIIPLRISDGR